MIRSLWIAKSGLDTQQTNLDVITNNLSNNQTIAFKKVRPIFSDLLYQTLRSPTSTGSTNIPVGLEVGGGSRVAASQRINTPGSLNVSQNPLDVALSNIGYMQVRVSPVGVNPPVIGYTRSGNLQTAIDPNRAGNVILTNSEGYPVLDLTGNPISIAQDYSQLVIGQDGAVTYTRGVPPVTTTAGTIAHVLFANPSGLASGGSGLYYETSASGEPSVGTPNVGGRASIVQYYTELSNVNVAEELVGLIAAQRAYEITTRAVSASDQLLQKLGQL